MSRWVTCRVCESPCNPDMVQKEICNRCWWTEVLGINFSREELSQFLTLDQLSDLGDGTITWLRLAKKLKPLVSDFVLMHYLSNIVDELIEEERKNEDV